MRFGQIIALFFSYEYLKENTFFGTYNKTLPDNIFIQLKIAFRLYPGMKKDF
jgi:hypothetical protein